MSIWRQLTRGLGVLANRGRADAELDDEIRQYLDHAEAAARAEGLSPADARRAAMLQIGSVASVRDTVRASGWEHAIDTLAADVRYALRRVRRAPAFTA